MPREEELQRRAGQGGAPAAQRETTAETTQRGNQRGGQQGSRQNQRQTAQRG